MAADFQLENTWLAQPFAYAWDMIYRWLRLAVGKKDQHRGAIGLAPDDILLII